MKLHQLIGNTPLMELTQIHSSPNVFIYAKLEGNNPAGSVKDRAALKMIEVAVACGKLKPGMSIVEATSGNTGIALAMIASSMGFPIELVMPESATRERVLTMKAFGAKVTLTPREDSMEGAIDEAHRIIALKNATSNKAVMLDQFSNTANPLAHYTTTGPEMYRQTRGQITHLVSAMGTTGTIMGCSRYLKEQNNRIQIIGVQPAADAHIPGIRRWPKAYLPKIFDPHRVDTIVDVTEQQARQVTQQLAAVEGIFCGMSAGGAMAAALQIAQKLKQGTLVVIIPDRGDRYLSSDLFER